MSQRDCWKIEEGRQQPTKLSQIKSLWRWMRHHSELKQNNIIDMKKERKKRSVDGSIFRVVPPVCGGIKKDACEVTDEQSIDFSLEMDCSEWILFSFSFWGRGENKQTKQKKTWRSLPLQNMDDWLGMIEISSNFQKNTEDDCSTTDQLTTFTDLPRYLHWEPHLYYNGLLFSGGLSNFFFWCSSRVDFLCPPPALPIIS